MGGGDSSYGSKGKTENMSVFETDFFLTAAWLETGNQPIPGHNGEKWI